MAVKKFRKKIVAGNWKMNKTVADAARLASDIRRELGECRDVDVVLCPPFTALKAVGEVIDSSAVRLGAQNMHWEASGAYTGEISSGMLRDLFCYFVILGHSERRMYFHETDEVVNRKVKAAIAARLVPIMCVGETLQERDSGSATDVVRRQLRGGLDGADLAKSDIVIAYEPVWAIGTGRNATPDQVQEMHSFIRDTLKELCGEEKASSIRIQYGGSVKPDNAPLIMAQPDVDGGLIGGAALDARSFVQIVNAAMPPKIQVPTGMPDVV